MLEKLTLAGEQPLKLKWSLYEPSVCVFDQDESNIHLKLRWNAGLAAETGIEIKNSITAGIGFRQTLNNMVACTSKAFTYDTFDRILTEKETVPDNKWLQKTYNYGDGNVSSVQYAAQSGTLGTESFLYAYGHNTEIRLNGSTTIWKLTAENDLG